MSFNFHGNPPLPINSVPPPPPPSMGPHMQMALMGPQQGHQLGPALMHGQMVPPMMGPAMMGPQGFAMGPGPMMPSGVGGPGPIMNPSLNDAPLEFNTNKNKPPMPLTSEEMNRNAANLQDDVVIEIVNRDGRREWERDRDLRDRDKDRDAREIIRRNRDRGRDRERDRRDDRDLRESTTSSCSPNTNDSGGGGSLRENGASPSMQGAAPGGNMGALPPPPWAAAMMGGMPGYSAAMLGINHMMPSPHGIMDPAMMMGQYGIMGGGMLGADGMILAPDGSIITPGGDATPTKEIIHCKSCTLFPPNPNLPPPTTRERPPGCKTIFVGGLPENATEEMIREIFGRCGEMLTVRLSNKKFCHIRYVHESSVDEALYFSGYKMRIGSHTDLAHSGRLHVDFAQARDDQYEWECRQRQAQREQRHRDRVEQERMRVPSPPPVVHYTDHEASLVVDKIKNDETFTKAMQVVITWLERGDCNKRNANTFYSMIQTTNSHVRRLLTEKSQFEQELQKAKDLMKGRMHGIIMQ
ncbi:ecto-NOX disulfide-thiol exchanger 2 [Nilaparvata lugens]|uniref:ecto-NOX disulfide-thiol exchanger 2 n=1 Tax=Nilaparvata lugens TaxID=108931 RepID=UPI00193D177A|nr:ecto-NOX disulfide-thiol exchanger 2 [Nilaparvata lugens]